MLYFYSLFSLAWNKLCQMYDGVFLSPVQAGAEFDVSDEQVTNLRQTFQRLDTDMDG